MSEDNGSVLVRGMMRVKVTLILLSYLLSYL